MHHESLASFLYYVCQLLYLLHMACVTFTCKYNLAHYCTLHFRLLVLLPSYLQASQPRPPCPNVEHIRNPGDDHWREHHNLYGRESELKNLGEQIATAHVRKVSAVVSVCGIAGVGKSFLVRAFYDHFAASFESSAVVSASHPFDIMNFCQNLVDGLKPPEGDDIFPRIWRHLEEKQCLVVIDNLRCKEDWDMIEGRLILRASRTCIIVITREKTVARHCVTSDGAVCRVKGLEADAARSLFEKVHISSTFFMLAIEQIIVLFLVETMIQVNERNPMYPYPAYN